MNHGDFLRRCPASFSIILWEARASCHVTRLLVRLQMGRHPVGFVRIVSFSVTEAPKEVHEDQLDDSHQEVSDGPREEHFVLLFVVCRVPLKEEGVENHKAHYVQEQEDDVQRDDILIDELFQS